MSDSISKFVYVGDRQGFEWSFGDAHHHREFENQIVAVPLKSGNGILVVEPASDDAPHNATILDSSGDVRTNASQGRDNNLKIQILWSVIGLHRRRLGGDGSQTVR